LAARFYTITDAAFFVGTVALLNSLRLVGHDEELVVLDRGLTAAQRERLDPHCSFVTLADDFADAYLVKPFPALFAPTGVVVLMDSDMIATTSLDPVIELAEAGKICVYPDHPVDLDRWFPEWYELFDLGAPLRRAPYMNAGFVAVSVDDNPTFLSRWWDACQQVAERRGVLVDPEPLAQLDQDALNAILSSEVRDDEIERLPAYEWDLRRVRIVDAHSLVCAAGEVRQPLLHAAVRPKAWQDDGWRRLQLTAYLRLLLRVLFGSDVRLPLEPADVPVWLRPGAAGWATLRALRAANELPTLVRRLPRAPRRAVREVRRRLERF